MDTTARLHPIIQFYHQQKRMPSTSELARLFGFRSRNAADKVTAKLVAQGFLTKDHTGRLLPTRYFHEVRLLGAVEAGFPSPAEEELGDTMDLNEFLLENKEATYMLKVTGDSMIEAGILPGDLVLVERRSEAKDGDLVIAQIDHGWTLKRFRQRGRKVYLEPANKKYEPIYPQEDLKIAAVVIAAIRKY